MAAFSSVRLTTVRKDMSGCQSVRFQVTSLISRLNRALKFFADRPLVLDVAHAEPHSFIAEECTTSKKFHVSGKFGFIMKHNILSIFSRGKTMIKSCYFNVKVTAKTLPEEKDIYRVSSWSQTHTQNFLMENCRSLFQALESLPKSSLSDQMSN